MREPDPVYETNARDSGYEAEGSQHRTLGSIAVARDARWTAALTVPIPEADTVLIELERRGALPDGFRGAEDSTLLALPIGEIDALLALLAGITAAARRDGVLPSRS